ncbi:hypothetical protein [Streptomyces sp. NPDC058398]|uniref:hypothetical protein n=1 Tax=Streptomyces sp. NPDC058398 TaxID=3346479 RepID=UPI00366824EC
MTGPLIAEAVDTAATVGWAIVAWICVGAAVATGLCVGSVAGVWAVGRAVVSAWRAVTRPPPSGELADSRTHSERQTA